MKSRTAVILLSFIVGALFTSLARADDRRFSSTLNATESAQTGLSRLSSDQIAALDALVRHDVALALADPTPTVPRATLFSQRLADNERHLVGIELLNETELARLNTSVERYGQPLTPASAVLSNQSTDRTNLTSAIFRRTPEIHGSVTLMVGGGSQGYSEYGGAIDLSYYDPEHHFAIDVGYSEIHSSGGYGNRFCRDRRLNSILP